METDERAIEYHVLAVVRNISKPSISSLLALRVEFSGRGRPLDPSAWISRLNTVKDLKSSVPLYY